MNGDFYYQSLANDLLGLARHTKETDKHRQLLVVLGFSTGQQLLASLFWATMR